MSRTPTSERRGAAPRPALSPAQEGFTLAALIVILTIMAMFIAYTVPDQWSMIMKRERDRQTIFLMKQYARAIYRWQGKHNQTAPVSLEQLQEAKKPRLLRGNGKWPMPLTGKEEDWILVPPQALVQNITPATGGQQLTGPDGRPVPQQPQPTMPGQQQPAMRLNKDLSPPDYKGPFVAVRPNATGQSFIALNGMENYEEWVYTLQDLTKDIEARRAALTAR